MGITRHPERDGIICRVAVYRFWMSPASRVRKTGALKPDERSQSIRARDAQPIAGQKRSASIAPRLSEKAARSWGPNGQS